MIGNVIEVGGIKYTSRVLPPEETEPTCQGCDLNVPKLVPYCRAIRCMASERSDNTAVIYKLIK